MLLYINIFYFICPRSNGLNGRLNSLLRCYIGLKIGKSQLQRFCTNIWCDLVSAVDQWWDVYTIVIE